MRNFVEGVVKSGLLVWLAALAGAWLAELLARWYLSPYLYSIAVYAGINIILAASLNLIAGFTGQFSLGHAGFMAVGAYTAALVTMAARSRWPALMASPGASDVVFVLALGLGGVAAGVIGYFVGLPSLRLRGDYLAIVTLGFGEIIRVLILNLDFLGGARGLPGIAQLSNIGWVYTFVVLTLFVIWRILGYELGRSFVAVREDEIAAEAMGIDTTKAKVKAFMIGASQAGIAGGLFAHYLMYLNPSIFDFNRSIEAIIMVVLGGLGSLTGSVVAAVFLTGIKEALRPLEEMFHVDFRMIIYSLVLIITMLIQPNGLFGSLELKQIWARRNRRRTASAT